MTYKKALERVNDLLTYSVTLDVDVLDIDFNDTVATHLACKRALEKQIPKRPIHIHEEYSEHLWRRDKNGKIDLWAFESGFCNGPICTRCWHSECVNCNDDWETDPTEPCVIDKDICPVCGSSLGEPKYCPNCGQALDWSEKI